MFNITESFANVNNIKICYEIRGDGDPVILIHGFGAKKEEWIGQFLPLSEHFKVIRFDNRGSGKSDRPNEPYSMELFAKDTKELMDFLKIEKAHIIGWSVGGMIAQNLVLMFPNRVNKLVLINTLPYWPGEKTALEMYRDSKILAYEARMKDPVKAFFDGITPSFTRKFKKILLEDPKKKIHGLFSAEDLIEMDNADPTTPQDIINYTHALGHHNVLNRLPNIKKETLIICATHDRSTPMSMNVMIHERISKSELVIIEKAGHGSPKERAPEINQHIINFLKK